MNKILMWLYIISVLLLILLSIYLYIKYKVELKKEQENNRKQREKENKIDKETVENINNIVGGNIHTGNDILHHLAEERK